LSGDLVALLDHYGYEDSTFVGHDWGAAVVWGLALLHPHRVKRVINLSLPYQSRGEQPWIEFMEAVFGGDFYFVHFNRQPGVADAVLDENTFQFLRNLYRKNVPLTEPEPGMSMINLARAETPLGEPVMSDSELAVFVSAFESSGFTGSINWYRNLDRNWHLLADVNPIIQQPALMIYGDQDLVGKSENLTEFVPNVEVISLDCGHWIQQEKPEEATQAILKWLEQQGATQ
jgi:pimeloyl-ACP methyl ester carboxylesterase